ncbi:MAG: mechanosensitive ion channel family protein [Candidatus Woesearchaeota archaeon]
MDIFWTGSELSWTILLVVSFIISAWLALILFKKLMHRFVFKAQSPYVRRMGIFFLIMIFLFAGRILMYRLSHLFSINLNPNYIKILDSLIVVMAFIGISCLVEGLADLLAKKITNTLTVKNSVIESSIKTIKGLIRPIIIFLCITVVLRIWGIEIGPLLTGLGIAGIAVGLALQTTLGDVFAGMAIAFDREFKLEDTIEVGSTFGVVHEISARSVKIKTYDNQLVVLTNSQLNSQPIINHSAISPRRTKIQLRLEYGTDIDKVKKICYEVIDRVAAELKKEHKKDIILFEPESKRPLVYLNDFGEYGLNFTVFVWFPNFNEMYLPSERLRIEIYNALRREGIRFARPNRLLVQQDGNTAQ